MHASHIKEATEVKSQTSKLFLDRDEYSKPARYMVNVLHQLVQHMGTGTFLDLRSEA
jgi:hypothetical protein